MITRSKEEDKTPEELDDKEKVSHDDIYESDENLNSTIKSSTPPEKTSTNSPPRKKNATKAKSPTKRKSELEQLKWPYIEEEENLIPRRKKRKPAGKTGK